MHVMCKNMILIWVETNSFWWQTPVGAQKPWNLHKSVILTVNVQKQTSIGTIWSTVEVICIEHDEAIRVFKFDVRYVNMPVHGIKCSD